MPILLTSHPHLRINIHIYAGPQPPDDGPQQQFRIPPQINMVSPQLPFLLQDLNRSSSEGISQKSNVVKESANGGHQVMFKNWQHEGWWCMVEWDFWWWAWEGSMSRQVSQLYIGKCGISSAAIMLRYWPPIAIHMAVVQVLCNHISACGSMTWSFFAKSSMIASLQDHFV